MSSESTRTERLLAGLCQRSFLRMWSFLQPYRDEFKGKSEGQEICDVLAVLDQDVFIFSDKECKFQDNKPIDLAWKRWHRAAVEGAIREVEGAARWLRQFPDRVFFDKTCTTALPVEIPRGPNLRMHLIVVVHGAGDACKRHMNGGSGSLILNTVLSGTPETRPAEELFPFYVGCRTPSGAFVHVLDESSLEKVISTLDTPAEFRDFLRFKEDLVASGKHIISPGEEDLLGAYLALGDDSRPNAHGLGDLTSINLAVIEEGTWDVFQSHPAKAARDRANRDSYLWDGLIERFAKHAVEGTQYFTSPGGPQRTERILRILVAEPRTVRRGLIAEVLRQVDSFGDRASKVWIARGRAEGSVCYVFAILRKQPGQEDAQYRQERLLFVHLCASIARLQEPDCRVHVGIAFDPPDENGGSEDIVLIDDSVWNEELAERARRFQAETGLLTNLRKRQGTVREYPSLELGASPKGRDRNAPCPCGSGLKWKKCCGRPE